MIAVIDYEMGNIRSVEKALQHVGGDARMVNTPEALLKADKIVLPGVAAFGDAMEELTAKKLVAPIREMVARGVPYLGFCLGLQLLFETSSEGGTHRGLGILPGKVERFDFSRLNHKEKLSVPHMGWNQVNWTRPCPMLKGLNSGVYAYFAHSYYVVPAEREIIQTTTDYGYPITTSVWRDNIFATQFHPEKSQATGLTLLKNFVEL